MEPRDIVRICLLATAGALCLGLAAGALSFAFGGAQGGAGSFFALFVALAGLALLAVAVLLLGGAGVDAVWERVQRVRRGRG
jgi:hypothetical protein